MLVMHTGVTMKPMHTVKLALLYGYEIQCDVHGIDFMNMHKFQKDQWNYITLSMESMGLVEISLVRVKFLCKNP